MSNGSHFFIYLKPVVFGFLHCGRTMGPTNCNFKNMLGLNIWLFVFALNSEKYWLTGFYAIPEMLSNYFPFHVKKEAVFEVIV